MVPDQVHLINSHWYPGANHGYPISTSDGRETMARREAHAENEGSQLNLLKVALMLVNCLAGFWSFAARSWAKVCKKRLDQVRLQHLKKKCGERRVPSSQVRPGCLDPQKSRLGLLCDMSWMSWSCRESQCRKPPLGSIGDSLISFIAAIKMVMLGMVVPCRSMFPSFPRGFSDFSISEDLGPGLLRW